MTDSGTLYGKSLYDLAVSENLSDEIMEEMEAVSALLSEYPDYVRLLMEPSIAKKERLALLDEAFGGQIHPYLLNFMKILTENGLLREFRSCEVCYRGLWYDAHGITVAQVSSAAPLDSEQTEKLRDRLETLSGKTVILKTRIDPELLGGVQVELEGKLYDGTVKGKLSGIRRKLDETVL